MVLPNSLLSIVLLYVDGSTIDLIQEVCKGLSLSERFWHQKYMLDYLDHPIYGGAIRDSYRDLYHELTWSTIYTYPHHRRFYRTIKVREVQSCTYSLILVVDVLHQLWISGKIVYDYPILATEEGLSMVTRIPTKTARAYHGKLYIIDVDDYLWYAKKHVHKYLLHRFSTFKVRMISMYSDYLLLVDMDNRLWLCSRTYEDLLPLAIRHPDGTQAQVIKLCVDHQDGSMIGLTPEGYVCTWRFRYLALHNFTIYPWRALDLTIITREGYPSSYLFVGYEDRALYVWPNTDIQPRILPLGHRIKFLTSHHVHYFYLAGVITEDGQGYYLDRYCHWQSIPTERPLRQIYISNIWDLLLVSS